MTCRMRTDGSSSFWMIRCSFADQVAPPRDRLIAVFHLGEGDACEGAPVIEPAVVRGAFGGEQAPQPEVPFVGQLEQGGSVRRRFLYRGHEVLCSRVVVG